MNRLGYGSAKVDNILTYKKIFVLELSSQALHDVLIRQGLALLTNIRRNLKNRVMHLWDKLLLRKRPLMETVNEQLKNICQIEHTRHRSVTGFMVNLVAGLVAYSYRPKKPSLGLRHHLMSSMFVV